MRKIAGKTVKLGPFIFHFGRPRIKAREFIKLTRIKDEQQ